MQLGDTLLDVLDQGQVRQAIQMVLSGASDPENIPETIVRAWILAGQGDPGGAVVLLRPVLVALETGMDRRKHAHALLTMGVSSVMAGDLDPGTAMLERSLSMSVAVWPRAQALRYLGLALEQRSAWEGAAARYRAAAELYEFIGHDYGAGSARYGAATALAEMAEDEAARLELTAGIIQLRRSGAGPALSAALGLSATLVAEKNPVEGLKQLEEAESLADTSSMYRSDMGLRRSEVLLWLGRGAEAFVSASEAAALVRPGSPEAAWADHRMALARMQTGQHREALAYLRDDREFPAAVLLERLCLTVLCAAELGEEGTLDPVLDRLERLVRQRVRRRGVGGHLVGAAERMADPERAVRTLHLAVQLGAPIAQVEPSLRSLRSRGARIPLDRLWLERPLGQGGMGEVWKAIHRDGAPVAVKILRGDRSGDHAALFESEVQTIARLDHPGIVRVLAALRVDSTAAVMLERPEGSAALVMERVSGGSLDAHLSGMEWTEIRDLLLDLLDALAHAHARGVLHLDIKPGNVLVDTSEGRRVPRLADFGLAALARRAERRILGTPAYMAPEQGSGLPLGPPADLYALGCLAWQLVCGKTVFASGKAQTVLEQHRHAPLPKFEPLIAVPSGLEGWLRNLLAKFPQERYACAADAAWALGQLGVPSGESGGQRGVPASISTFDVGGLSTIRVGKVPTLPPRASVLASTLPVAPFRSDWRGLSRKRQVPFLSGAGEGLFAWRVGSLVGRDREREQVWKALGEVHQGARGRVIWVTGADGMGRSALLRWLAETAHASGAAEVYESQGVGMHPVQGARPALILVDDAEGGIGLDPEIPALLVVAGRQAPPEARSVLRLEPMTAQELAALLDDRLPLDRELARSLAERAAGSPAFAVALLTDLVRRDLLEAGPEGFRLRDRVEMALPQDLHGLWAERLDALAPVGSPRRSAWEIAAVLGPALALEDWRRACRAVGLTPAEDTFIPLETDGWIEQGGGRLRFRVPAVQEALVVAAQESGRATVWHSAAADTMAGTGDAAAARHLHLAGRHREALLPLRKAAADAVNATRLEECRQLLELWGRSADALGMAADDPRRGSPLVVRVHLALHTREDPHPILQRGLALARGRDPELECQLTYTKAWILAQEGRHAEAEAAYHVAIALAAPGSDLLLIAQIGLAASVFAQGRDAMPLAEGCFASRIRPELICRLEAVCGRGMWILGRVEMARAYLSRAIGNARGVAPDIEAEARGDLATILQAEGDLEGAIQQLETAVVGLEAAGSDKALAVSVRLAGLLLDMGLGTEARTILGPIRQRYGWRLRPEVASEMERIEAALRPTP